jgi:hypothetical protein
MRARKLRRMAVDAAVAARLERLRVAAMDGQLTIDSPMGAGTRITATIPHPALPP